MPNQLEKTKLTIMPVLLAVLLFLHGCNNSAQHHAAAPLGEITALQALEKAYNAALNGLPTGPAKLKPSVRRKFVEQVFQDAGYNYSATLLALADIPLDAINQHHKDMKELLFLPHHALAFEDVKAIYTKEEQNAISTIKERARNNIRI